MRVLITGASGMLAADVIKEFQDHELLLTDYDTLDITSQSQVENYLQAERPGLIINCAAYTNVDKAEEEPEKAEAINAGGPENLAKNAAKINATLVHISTDYVFEGTAPTDYHYQETDETNPRTVYGKTKLHGEKNITKNLERHYIFRTAWLYGKNGKNFVETMLSLADKQPEIKVIKDQHGSPTYTRHLANAIKKAIDAKIPYGIYHATNTGYTTWADFAVEIFRQFSTEAPLDVKITPITSAEYPVSTPRPQNSQLSLDKLNSHHITMPKWQDALKEYLTERSINE